MNMQDLLNNNQQAANTQNNSSTKANNKDNSQKNVKPPTQPPPASDQSIDTSQTVETEKTSLPKDNNTSPDSSSTPNQATQDPNSQATEKGDQQNTLPPIEDTSDQSTQQTASIQGQAAQKHQQNVEDNTINNIANNLEHNQENTESKKETHNPDLSLNDKLVQTPVTQTNQTATTNNVTQPKESGIANQTEYNTTKSKANNLDPANDLDNTKGNTESASLDQNQSKAKASTSNQTQQEVPTSQQTNSSPTKDVQQGAPSSKKEDQQELLGVRDEPFPYTIDQLLEMCIEKKASDLHICTGYPAKLRIDGELHPISGHILDADTAKDLIYSILPEDIKEVVEVSKEADLAHAYKDKGRFRVNVYHAMNELSAAFRLIPNRIRSIEELNLPKIYHEFATWKQGLILVTGPTGHGKSTTLASILNEINKNRPEHIITIEDPIEYVYPREKALVDQREMKNDTHSWEIALKSVLREDPDVVLVGEMRDFETISSAITIAETGHLVFATLHTQSAAQTINRIIDVFPEHQQEQIRSQLANTIKAVVAQRLVKLTGGGRRAVSEIMLVSPAIRNLIREKKVYQIDNTIRTSGDMGMKSIEKSLVELVREGLISVDVAKRNALNPEEITRLLK